MSAFLMVTLRYLLTVSRGRTARRPIESGLLGSRKHGRLLEGIHDTERT